jgi:alpha-tubulin suppressor-like RCC1 family protein
LIPDDAPLEVLNDATFMSAGAAHTCAIRTDRSLWCWGRNTEGQLGIGTVENTNNPTPVVFPAGCPL